MTPPASILASDTTINKLDKFNGTQALDFQRSVGTVELESTIFLPVPPREDDKGPIPI